MGDSWGARICILVTDISSDVLDLVTAQLTESWPQVPTYYLGADR